MCQCVLCDCFWVNICGIPCGGVHNACLCFSYWCCKPDELKALDADCCKFCVWSGWGGNCFCYGKLCCAPEAIKTYSRSISGDMVGSGIIVTPDGTSNVGKGPLINN